MPIVMSYQNVSGTVNAGAHPGSYNGQDAYNDMLVVDDGIKCRKWTAESDEHVRTMQHTGHDARQTSDTYRGGWRRDRNNRKKTYSDGMRTLTGNAR